MNWKFGEMKIIYAKFNRFLREVIWNSDIEYQENSKKIFVKQHSGT